MDVGKKIVMKKFEHPDHRLPPRSRGVMKEYDLSDRKLKIAVVLAIAIIAWLCLKGASNSHGQRTPTNAGSAAVNATAITANADGAAFIGF
jgi:hypothetical protein